MGPPTWLNNQGDLLEGFAVSEPRFEEWLLAERERVRELVLEALAKLLAHHTRAGSTERAVTTAARLLALDPLQEAVHHALMRLYVRQGRRAAALKQYQVCVSVLQRELGAEPEPETKQLYQEVLRRASPAAAAEMSSPQPRGPRRELTPVPLPVHETAIIGREPEVAYLEAMLDDAVGGHGRCVFVVGEAGIGKTRLVAELAALAAARAARVFVGRAFDSARILPFGPWVEALRNGQATADTAVLDGLSPVWRADLGRLLPELHAGAPHDAGAGGEDALRLFEAMTQLITGLARPTPLVLIVEDMHWADEMSLRLLSFLGRRVAGLRVLLVATAREEEIPDAPALARTLAELRRELVTRDLDVRRLSRDATATLVEVLGRSGREATATAELADGVWRASQGNPFIAVEMLRAFEQGTTPRDATVTLPERVRELISQRLARLSPQAQEAATVAAVFGREFDFALLCHATGLGEREAAEAVEELVRRRVLDGVGERFDFTHDRIREVVYGALLAPRRRLIHGRIGAAIEQVYGRDLAPHVTAVGTHYFNAERWDAALAYLWKAGLQAAARSAHREAVICFDRALAAAEQLPETRDLLVQTIDLRFDLRNSLFPLGEQDRLASVLHEAAGQAERLDDEHRFGRASGYLGLYHWIIGDHDQALTHGRRALVAARTFGDLALEIRSNYYLGVTEHARGHYRVGAEYLRANLETLTGDLVPARFGLSGAPSVLSRTWITICLVELGDFPEARAVGEEALRIAEGLDDPFALIAGTFGAALPLVYQGDFAESAPLLERALALSRRWNIPAWAPRVASTLGCAYACSGRIGEAVVVMESAAKESLSIRRLVGHSLELARLADILREVGRVADATHRAMAALAHARAHHERGHEAHVCRVLGEIAARTAGGDPAAAVDDFRRALTIAAELGMRPLSGHCHLGLGELYAKIGKPLEAHSALMAAADLYRAMAMTFWLPRVETALATLPSA